MVCSTLLFCFCVFFPYVHLFTTVNLPWPTTLDRNSTPALSALSSTDTSTTAIVITASSTSSPSNSGSKNILLFFIPVFVFPILFCVVLLYVYCECTLRNAARANLPRRGPEMRTYAVPTTEVAQNKLIHHYYMNSMWTLFNEACLRFYLSELRTVSSHYYAMYPFILRATGGGESKVLMDVNLPLSNTARGKGFKCILSSTSAIKILACVRVLCLWCLNHLNTSFAS